MSDTPRRYVVLEGRVRDVNATGFDDSVVPLYVRAEHYDKCVRDLAAANGRAERAEAERDVLKVDAKRYRWITSGYCGCPFAETDSAWDSKANLDAAIDAEINKGEA